MFVAKKNMTMVTPIAISVYTIRRVRLDTVTGLVILVIPSTGIYGPVETKTIT